LAAIVGLDPKTRLVFTVVAWVSLLTIIAVFVYGAYESYVSPGQPWGRVVVDVYWPFGPYFAQLVTYFSVACVALFYSGLRLWETRISRWPSSVVSLLQVLGFVVAFSSAYEVIYNFIFWGAIYTVEALQRGTSIPDLINSNYPVPWSFVFATKAFSALFVISGYSVYFLRQLKSKIG